MFDKKSSEISEKRLHFMARVTNGHNLTILADQLPKIYIFVGVITGLVVSAQYLPGNRLT